MMAAAVALLLTPASEGITARSSSIPSRLTRCLQVQLLQRVAACAARVVCDAWGATGMRICGHTMKVTHWCLPCAGRALFSRARGLFVLTLCRARLSPSNFLCLWRAQTAYMALAGHGSTTLRQEANLRREMQPDQQMTSWMACIRATSTPMSMNLISVSATHFQHGCQ